MTDATVAWHHASGTTADELTMAKLLTGAMSVDEIDLSEYPDIYADESQARRMS